MSNYWDLTCRTCDETHRLEWNRGGERIQSLIPLLPELATMQLALDRLGEYFYDLQYPSDLFAFAAEHHAHDLIAVDEYGKFFDACGQYFLCPCCGHSTHCKLPLEHAGDHAPKTGG